VFKKWLLDFLVMTRQYTLRFSLLFLVAMLLSYALQMGAITYFSLVRDLNVIAFSYLFTTIYIIFFALFIFLYRHKYKDHIGFIVMAGSVLKIAVFLFLVKWSALSLNKNVFLDFFIPYLVSLSLEVYWVSRILNPRE